MKKSFLFPIIIFTSAFVHAQQPLLPRINQFVDMAGIVGSSQGAISGSYVYNWRLGKSKKWEAGIGLWYGGYFGVIFFYN